MELSIPRRTRPLLERLLRADGLVSDRTLAERLIRRLETEAAARPGDRLRATCSPEVARAAEPLVKPLLDKFGARVIIEPSVAGPRDQFHVGAV